MGCRLCVRHKHYRAQVLERAGARERAQPNRGAVGAVSLRVLAERKEQVPARHPEPARGPPRSGAGLLSEKPWGMGSIFRPQVTLQAFVGVLHGVTAQIQIRCKIAKVNTLI